MTKAISPLRQRMIDDMKIRNMSPNTQKAYIRAVQNFSRHFGQSPDRLTFEHVRQYQLHLVSRRLQAATIIPIMCAIRFFYGTTRGRANVAEHIPLARKADTLPAILTRDSSSSTVDIAIPVPPSLRAAEPVVSAPGTNRTNRAGLWMSVDRGRPEVAGSGSKRRF
jgi:site-specific recombinase XerD